MGGIKIYEFIVGASGTPTVQSAYEAALAQEDLWYDDRGRAKIENGRPVTENKEIHIKLPAGTYSPIELLYPTKAKFMPTSPEEPVLIMGSGLYPCIYFNSLGDRVGSSRWRRRIAPTFSHFSLQDGFGKSFRGAFYGGGFFCPYGQNPRFFDCVFDNCSADYGGGVSAPGSVNVDLIRCRFRNCTANIAGSEFYNEQGSSRIDKTIFEADRLNSVSSFASQPPSLGNGGQFFVSDTVFLGNVDIKRSYMQCVRSTFRGEIKALESYREFQGNTSTYEVFPSLFFDCALLQTPIGTVGSTYVLDDSCKIVPDEEFDVTRFVPLMTSQLIDSATGAVPINFETNFPYENNEKDVLGNPRGIGGGNDVGAAENVERGPAEIAPFPMQGDANGDGIVNLTDQLMVIANWGKVGDSVEGDVNRDGKVDIQDLLEVITNWGKEHTDS